MCLNTDGCVSNSVDPDQMPQSAAFDLGLHCCRFKVITVAPDNMIYAVII